MITITKKTTGSTAKKIGPKKSKVTKVKTVSAKAKVRHLRTLTDSA